MIYTLPLPPSVNAMYRNTPRGRAKTRAYTEWKNAAWWSLVAQAQTHKVNGRTSKVSGPYSLVIRVPEKTRGDIDNRVKGTVDVLVSTGLTPDDKHMRSVTIARDAVSELTVEIIPHDVDGTTDAPSR